MQTIRELAGSIFSIRKNQEQWDVAGSVCEEEEWSEKGHGFPKDGASLKILYGTTYFAWNEDKLRCRKGFPGR